MDGDQLIAIINKSVEDLDFVTTRKLLEENMDFSNSNRLLLKKNARELLDFLIESQDSGVKPLGRKELAVVNTINVYATKFDIRGLKFVVKENAQLLLRKDVLPYLNADAQALLGSMGVITKSSDDHQ